MALAEHVWKCLWVISLYQCTSDWGDQKEFHFRERWSAPHTAGLCRRGLQYTAMSETVAKGIMLSPTIENSLVTNMWSFLYVSVPCRKSIHVQMVRLDFKKSKHFIARSGFTFFFFFSTAAFMSVCGSKVGSGPRSGLQEMRICLKPFELHDSSVWYWLFPHRHKRNLKGFRADGLLSNLHMSLTGTWAKLKRKV